MVAKRGQVMTVPEPPFDLVDEEAAEWRRQIIDMDPSRCTPETLALLTQLCRHIVCARRIARNITKFNKAKHHPIKPYNDLLRMQERETRCIVSIAKQIRIAVDGYGKTKGRGGRRVSLEASPWNE
ncbi:hypothetical protein [Aquibaculum sediminis]|uniref:hypothetical protein n=1 Tax=Aquibaculum sediminis TaxID=3231907 RepID=UPI0034548CBE